MTFRIQFAPKALEQLDALEEHIVAAGSPIAAARFVDSIVAYCESLGSFPMRATQRDDLFPGLRVTNFRRRTVIAFSADMQTRLVSILGVFYGGQNYEAVFRGPPNPSTPQTKKPSQPAGFSRATRRGKATKAKPGNKAGLHDAWERGHASSNTTVPHNYFITT